ncbi:DUF4232 domain-containing protein [Amycolatopsis sp. NPDC052450]|uniref:DUF4232 domain-containing protein n=1 Tax=Amycolatopsis sp. NPDC052450 TaxID=3363937 RepID=UPI0037C6159B
MNVRVKQAAAVTVLGIAALTATGPAEAATSRCATADLAVSLGEPTQLEEATGQYEVPLTFENVSPRACGLHGVPDVDLVGPADPNGPVYHLPRVADGEPGTEVPPGSTATATVTVLSRTSGSTGSQGSPAWTPSKLVTVPPGQTEALSVDWPSGLPVLRQDAATRPGSWVSGIVAGPA